MTAKIVYNNLPEKLVFFGCKHDMEKKEDLLETFYELA